MPHIRRWRQPPIPSSIPIAEPGIARTRSQGLMRTSPSSWSSLPRAPAREADSPAAAAFLERSAALYARPARPSPPRAGSRRQQAASRRIAGSAAAARERRRRPAGRVGSCQAEVPARPDRGGSEPRRSRAAAAARRGQAARTARRFPLARRLPGRSTSRKRRRQARPGDDRGRTRSAPGATRTG